MFVKVFGLVVKWFYFSTDIQLALCHSDAHIAETMKIGLEHYTITIKVKLFVLLYS